MVAFSTPKIQLIDKITAGMYPPEVLLMKTAGITAMIDRRVRSIEGASPVSKVHTDHHVSHLNFATVWGPGAIAAAILIASTLQFDVFRNNLGARTLVMLVGMLPATFALCCLVRRGSIDPTNRRRLLFVIMAVHVIATLYFFPLPDILNGRPALNLDHSFHYYQAYRAREIFWDTLRLDRYDPFFMAGYPGGTIFDLDMKGAETFCGFIPFVSAARALKLFILFAYLTLVPAIYWGSRMQGFKIEESVFGLLVFLAWWHWGRPYAGDFRYAGMFSFVLATHLCFLLVGLLRQAARGTCLKTFFALGPIAFLIHPTSVVMLPVPFAVSIGADWRLWRRKKWILLVLWCVGIVVVNSLWLEPFFKYVWMKTTTEAYYQIEGWSGLTRLLVKPSCLIALSMITLSIVGIVKLAAERRWSVGIPVAAGAVILFFVAGFGVYAPGLDQLEPGRFLFSFFVFLTPLAGVGTRLVVDAVLSVFRSQRLKSGLRTAAIVVLILAALPLSLLESRAYYPHTMKTEMPAEVASMVEALSSRIEPPGRLMIEDCAAMHYGDIHLPALLPLMTGVEQIGGPYPHTYLLYYFSTFRWEKTFGRPMSEWTLDSIKPYLQLYDVRWILTATQRSTRFISDLLGREAAWSQPPYALWRVGAEVAGSGQRGSALRPTVKAGINWIEITGNGDPDGYLIDYHWVPGLSASGSARIRPVHRLDDPVPFIFVEPNGEDVVTITY